MCVNHPTVHSLSFLTYIITFHFLDCEEGGSGSQKLFGKFDNFLLNFSAHGVRGLFSSRRINIPVGIHMISAKYILAYKTQLVNDQPSSAGYTAAHLAN